MKGIKYTRTALMCDAMYIKKTNLSPPGSCSPELWEGTARP